MRRRLLALLLVALPGLVAPAQPAQAGEFETVARGLERAFQDSNARLLRAVLTSEKKVRLAVPEVHDGDGIFGSDQVVLMFQDFFKEHPTRKFELAESDFERTGSIAEARGRYRFEGGSNGEDRSKPLLFTLAREGDRWVVTEIRAVRP